MKFANTRVLEETMYRVIPKGWGVPEIALAVPPGLTEVCYFRNALA